MKLKLSDIDNEKINNIKGSVESYSSQIDSIVLSIVNPVSKKLDDYVRFISEILQDGQEPPTTSELEDFCMNLSTQIYFVGGASEHLGIRDDISKAVYKDMYHTARASQEDGTVADKDSLAELSSQQELIVNICYNRAYKIMKSKVDNAQELLSSCKKVLSHRMQEMELTRLNINN